MGKIRKISVFLMLFAFALASGCASVRSRNAPGTGANSGAPGVETEDLGAQKLDEAQLADVAAAEKSGEFEGLSDEGKKVLRELLAEDVVLRQDSAEGTEKERPKVPFEFNAKVAQWIQFFTVKDRERFTRYLERAEVYRPLVEQTLKHEGVPSDLFYLALIESGYDTRARSRAKAVGPWQFMRPTARQYGMKVDSLLDERRDIVQSTQAAARYLKDIHQEFGSWYLTLAAYNAGPGRIRAAIRKGKSRNFWVLANARYGKRKKKDVLPIETHHYVPKFLAAVMIGKNPEKFGFKIEKPAPWAGHKVGVPPLVRLNDLAKLTETDPDVLKSLNPHLSRGITVKGKSGRAEIYVAPKDVAAFRELDEVEVADLKVPKREVLRAVAQYEREERSGRRPSSFTHSKSYGAYRIRKGDTLASIAARFQMSVTHLKRVNGMKKSRIKAGQLIRVKRKDR